MASAVEPITHMAERGMLLFRPYIPGHPLLGCAEVAEAMGNPSAVHARSGEDVWGVAIRQDLHLMRLRPGVISHDLARQYGVPLGGCAYCARTRCCRLSRRFLSHAALSVC